MVQRLRCRSLPTWTPTPHSSMPSSVGTPKALPYPECPWAQTAAGGAGWLEGLVASLTFLWIQVSLKTSALGSSVEEVEQLIRKHEVFLKVLTAQDKKVMESGGLGVVRMWRSGESPEGGHGALGAFLEAVLISLRGWGPGWG